MVAVPRCLRATRVRLLRRAPAPDGIPRCRQAARHRARIGTRPRAPLAGARPARSVCARHLRGWHARARGSACYELPKVCPRRAAAGRSAPAWQEEGRRDAPTTRH